MILIDFSNLFFRNFHTHLKKLTNKSGVGTGGCFGVLNSLFYLFTKYNWSIGQSILVQDRRPVWKYKIFPDYKSGRKREDLPKLMSVPLQLKMTRLILSLLGFTFAKTDGEECDDVIMTLTKKITNMGHEVTIYSGDHDMYQCLIDPKVKLMIPQKDTEQIFNEDLFLRHSEIYPECYWMVQALGGCSTDKVPGLPGIGEPSAQKIVNMNSWNKIKANDPNLVFPDSRSKTMFRKNYDKWNIERDIKLIKLKSDLEVQFKHNKMDEKKLREWFVKLGFNSYLEPTAFTRLIKVFSRKK